MYVKIFAGVCVIVLLVWVSVVFLRTPQAEREWEASLARTATADISDEVVVLRNVRDFSYEDEVVEQWVDEVVVNPEEITRVWFVLEPFGGLPLAGHTFLTFEFEDGEAYSFSVEARKEVGEEYSAFWGLFRKYELAYSWGTEQDFMDRRVEYLGHEVYRYPLVLNENEMKVLFVGLARETQRLAETPRFYNTLNANCTNMLAKMVNRIDPGRIPYDISWNLPGYSDRFLLRIGRIDFEGTYREAREAYGVSD